MTNRKTITVTLALAACLALAAPASLAEEQPAFDIDIPFEKFVLDNGLTVIVHEDRKAPIVAVSVWYHVGSRDEPPGKTGFAHLFEHLMFEGTENYDHEFTAPFEQIGATQQNGTTWFDRTNYFQTVPTPALDMALWMESERMGHLLGAVTQEKLDQERAVVKNEKRQGDNQPYGRVGYRVLEGLFPPGHPYRHDTIGSMEDLDAASLEDIHRWFRDYYGAANAVLVLAGDVSPQQGVALAERYFGDIEPGPPITRVQAWVPDRRAETHEVMVDEVPHVRSHHYWAVPGRTTHERALLQLAADVLGDGKNSRLYKALIWETQQAVELSVSLEPHQLASLFEITVTLGPEATVETVSAIIDQELQRLFEHGPGEEELRRARSKISAGMIRGFEQVGGFSGKAVTLAQGELYDGRPDFYKTLLAWINDATAEEVRDATRAWLSDGRYRLDVFPSAGYSAGEPRFDRSSGIPPVGPLPDVSFPAVERARLRNGVEVVLARRRAVPVVNVTLQFDAGFAADAGRPPGTSRFTLAMLEESTTSRSALEVDALAESLGAEIYTAANLDMSTVNLSALRQNLDASLELLADVTRNPAFAPDEIDRTRKRWLARIEHEMSEPTSIALRTLPPLIYGEEHAYGIPFTGSGTLDSINRLDRSELVRFHREWLRPDNATVFVAGDTSLEEIIPMLEEHLGNWRAPRKRLPEKNIGEVALPEQSRIHIFDRPGSPQSLILAGHLAPPTGVADNIEIAVMNDILGGTYTARVNQKLRVDKGWSYGAFTWLPDARGQRPWLVYAPVQTDRTAAAVEELLEEIARFVGEQQATEEERLRAVRSNANRLPGEFETAEAVLGALLENQRFGRPDDYVDRLKARYESIDVEAVRAAARNVLRPARLTWVVVGDRAAIEGDLAALAEARGIAMD